ncbi:hypothetical protein AAC387_Pa09g0327 [Persea americana]
MALLSSSQQLSVLEPSGRIAQWPRTMALLSSSQQLSSFWPSKGQLLLHSITTSKASLILCRGPRTCNPTNSFKTCAIPKPISGFRRTCPAQLSWVRREAFTLVLGSENPSLTNKKRNHGDFRVRAFSEEQTAFVVKPWNAMKKDAGELDLKFLLRVLVLIVSKPLKWE